MKAASDGSSISVPPKPKTPKELVDQSYKAFEEGRLNDAEPLLEHVFQRGIREKELLDRMILLSFLLGVFGKGDPERNRRLNREIDLRFRPDLRYRMALRMRDWRMAKKLRLQPGLDAQTTRDFHWSAAHRMLWSNRIGCGLRLYDNRVGAKNFTRILPSWLKHQPFRNDAQELRHVVIEQGVGDALVHLAQFRKVTSRDDHIFFGLPWARAVIQRLYPHSEFVSLAEEPPKHLRGLHVHCAADYLIAAHQQFRSFQLDAPLFSVAPRQKPRFAAPRFGISWRGGSAQNRRDERQMPLHFLLDMLPANQNYVILQHDIEPEEEKLIRERPNLFMPHMEIKGAAIELIDLISELDGVISVDNTTLHIAGALGVPVFGMMNPTSHWFFAPDGQFSRLYPQAETTLIKETSHLKIAAFIEKHATRAPNEPKRKKPARKPPGLHPIFITAPPRSRTSMTSGALHAGGLWMGETIPANPENPRGYFENRIVRQKILKPSLSFAGYDPLGVRSLPPRDFDAPSPRLHSAFLKAFREEGWDGKQPFGYKDTKLLLVWRQWARAFPGALWLLPQREDEEIIRSCLRTSFMRYHSGSESFWAGFLQAYRAREQDLIAGLENARYIPTAEWKEGRISPELVRLLEAYGLNVEAIRAYLKEGIPEKPS